MRENLATTSTADVNRTPDAPPEEGANLVGFFQAEFGQGEVARRLDRALRHAGIPHTTIPYGAVPHRQDHVFEQAEGELYDVNVLCLNAEHLVGYAESEAAERFSPTGSPSASGSGRRSVFPEYLRPALKYVDEIWVASEFVAEALRAATSVPVRTFPLPVLRRLPRGRPGPISAGRRTASSSASSSTSTARSRGRIRTA